MAEYQSNMDFDFICEPIYSVNGESLMAVEVLTHFYDDVGQRKKNTADIIDSMSLEQKAQFFYYQIEQIKQQHKYFKKSQVLCSVNIDNDIAEVLKSNKKMCDLLLTLPFVRLEVNENYRGLDSCDSEELLLPLLRYVKGVWLDDFGTGKSTLSTISKKNFEVVKIDKDFFWQEYQKDSFPVLIKRINHSCGRIVIEGVEELTMLLTLAELNIWGVQGYAFPSVPLKNIMTLLE